MNRDAPIAGESSMDHLSSWLRLNYEVCIGGITREDELYQKYQDTSRVAQLSDTSRERLAPEEMCEAVKKIFPDTVVTQRSYTLPVYANITPKSPVTPTQYSGTHQMYDFGSCWSNATAPPFGNSFRTTLPPGENSVNIQELGSYMPGHGWLPGIQTTDFIEWILPLDNLCSARRVYRELRFDKNMEKFELFINNAKISQMDELSFDSWQKLDELFLYAAKVPFCRGFEMSEDCMNVEKRPLSVAVWTKIGGNDEKRFCRSINCNLVIAGEDAMCEACARLRSSSQSDISDRISPRTDSGFVIGCSTDVKRELSDTETCNDGNTDATSPRTFTERRESDQCDELQVTTENQNETEEFNGSLDTIGSIHSESDPDDLDLDLPQASPIGQSITHKNTVPDNAVIIKQEVTSSEVDDYLTTAPIDEGGGNRSHGRPGACRTRSSALRRKGRRNWGKDKNEPHVGNPDHMGDPPELKEEISFDVDEDSNIIIKHTYVETDNGTMTKNVSLQNRVKCIADGNICDLCGKSFKTTATLAVHKKTHTEEKSFHCDQCDKYFKQAKYLNAHKRTHLGERPFKCNECGKGFSQPALLAKHIMRHTGERPFPCDVCGKAFRQSAHLKDHKRTHTGEKPFKCDECDRAFAQSHSLLRHKQTHFGVDRPRPFSCDQCDKTFMTSSHLWEHKRVHSGEKPYMCELCGKSFSPSGRLRAHKLTHTDERPFACEVCGKAFRTVYHLADHKRIHSGEKPFMCDECGKSFAQSRGLVAHKQNHNGEKPFQCDLCEKSFRLLPYLNDHKLIHSGEKPHTCDLCGKSFIRPAELVKHKKCHTGEKPYTCEECGRGFRQMAHLKEHRNTHSGEKLYKCGQCGKGFAQLTGLFQHKQTHTGIKPYACAHCGKSFQRHSHLKKHSRLHIGESF